MSEKRSNTIAVVQHTLLPREITLIHKLIIITADTSLNNEQRMLASLDAMLEMVSDIPVLNADGALVQPLYAIRNQMRGQVKSGGKYHSDYALQLYAVAFVNILHAEGSRVEDACAEAATLLGSCGRHTSWKTVKDWRVGQQSRAFIEAVREVEEIVRTHIPMTSKDMSCMKDRARHWLEEQCKVHAKYD